MYRRIRNMFVPLAALAAAAMTAACSENAGPTDIPEPGFLVASITMPGTEDRAVLVTIHGPGITGVDGGISGYVVHYRSDPGAVRIAAFGDLRSGPLLRFRVPDARVTSKYTVQVVEVSGPQNELRDDLVAYRVELARQP
ncbi:MAG TPA: hypothetical protein VK936_12450 [Longimicrobiales bacterium]|nr:hypothetical protein [Longimicrobiales bacterium]